MGLTQREAGRDLDALVAEKIMGLSIKWLGEDGAGGRDLRIDDGSLYGQAVPYYSTDIKAAWPLVRTFGLAVAAEKGGDSFVAGWVHIDRDDPGWSLFEMAATAPLAICRAALEAKGGRIKQMAENEGRGFDAQASTLVEIGHEIEGAGFDHGQIRGLEIAAQELRQEAGRHFTLEQDVEAKLLRMWSDRVKRMAEERRRAWDNREKVRRLVCYKELERRDEAAGKENKADGTE
jgi:hypothetical protein